MLLGGLVSSLVPNIWGLVSSLVPNIWWQEKEEPCSSDEERAWYRAQNVDEKESEHPPEPKLRRQTDSCGFVFPAPKVRADKPNSTASSSRDPGAVDRQFFENWARELEAEMKKEAEEIAMAEVWAQEIEMEAKKPRSGVPRAFLHGSVPSCVQPAWQQTDAASQSWDGGSGAWHGEWSNHHGSQQSNGEQAWDGAAETWWDDAAGDGSNHHWTETWQQDLPAESWDGHKGDWSDEAWPTTAASEEGASAWHGDWWDSTWEWQDDNEGSQDEAWAKDWSEEIWSEHRNKRVRGHDSPASMASGMPSLDRVETLKGWSGTSSASALATTDGLGDCMHFARSEKNLGTVMLKTSSRQLAKQAALWAAFFSRYFRISVKKICVPLGR